MQGGQAGSQAAVVAATEEAAAMTAAANLYTPIGGGEVEGTSNACVDRSGRRRGQLGITKKIRRGYRRQSQSVGTRQV